MYVGLVEGSLTSELRGSVLRPAWPVGSVMHGDTEPGALHLAALDDLGTPVCACVLFLHAFPSRPSEPAWKLRGMATAPQARSRGVGGLVLEAAAAEVAARGAVLLWCEAREAAVPFYARHDFVTDGERYLHSESGLPHFLMIRELSSGSTSSDEAGGRT
jgi:predicted GNAT family N-acyltransferase